MIIDAPTAAQLPALRSLWREAFGDTEEFLDAFKATALSADRCRCAVADGALAGALYWFDCFCQGKRLAYLYAVATAKAFRGRGICHALMEDTHRHLERLGYQGTVLVPGEAELFRLYVEMGYRTCSTLRSFLCGAGPEDAALYRIDTDEYARLRRQFLPAGGVIQEKESLDFLATQASFYAGTGFLLAARREGDRLNGIELLGNSEAAPGIVEALGCAEGTFRTPGPGQPFAMYRPLGENAPEPPTYFGLAFD